MKVNVVAMSDFYPWLEKNGFRPCPDYRNSRMIVQGFGHAVQLPMYLKPYVSTFTGDKVTRLLVVLDPIRFTTIGGEAVDNPPHEFEKIFEEET